MSCEEHGGELDLEEGVFLRRDLSKGSLAAIYNGVRMTTREARKRKG